MVTPDAFTSRQSSTALCDAFGPLMMHPLRRRAGFAARSNSGQRFPRASGGGNPDVFHVRIVPVAEADIHRAVLAAVHGPHQVPVIHLLAAVGLHLLVRWIRQLLKPLPVPHMIRPDAGDEFAVHEHQLRLKARIGHLVDARAHFRGRSPSGADRHGLVHRGQPLAPRPPLPFDGDRAVLRAGDLHRYAPRIDSGADSHRIARPRQRQRPRNAPQRMLLIATSGIGAVRGNDVDCSQCRVGQRLIRARRGAPPRRSQHHNSGRQGRQQERQVAHGRLRVMSGVPDLPPQFTGAAPLVLTTETRDGRVTGLSFDAGGARRLGRLAPRAARTPSTTSLAQG